MARPKVNHRNAKPEDNGRVPGAELPPLVRDLVLFVRGYVVMTDAQLLITALWVIHTHCFQTAAQTPYLAVTSPERQCGKSRLLEVLEMLVQRAWLTVVPSEAVLFRKIDLQRPTLLLDEVDTIFNPRSADRYEGHRALLNSDHRSGTTVSRCVGTSGMQDFRVFCPKVLAGIGTLPDTVADRSIPIRLERRKRDEPIERFKRREAEPRAEALVDQIEKWLTEKRLDALHDVQPEAVPDELSDRAQEGSEPLVAIADLIGCGDDARAALVELLTAERLDDQETMRLRLLRDIQTVFDRRPNARGVLTQTLVTELVQMEEAPWETYYKRGLEPRDLATLLHHYGIRSTTIRGRDKVAKGYKRDDLQLAWERYLS
jgi:hypothetical protein